ncbi:MAG TPA: hypothetical protein VMW50_03280 [Dehalococcoidia bacterium]|nr:hypothetical protein [Dehalococcoidia bacterium]
MTKRQIAIEDETWMSLNQLKEPGDTFDEVIKKLLTFWWKKNEEGEP